MLSLFSVVHCTHTSEVQGMSDKLKIFVQSLLRPSEVVNASLEVYLLAQDINAWPQNQGSQSHARVVCVITHLGPQRGDGGQGW